MYEHAITFHEEGNRKLDIILLLIIITKYSAVGLPTSSLCYRVQQQLDGHQNTSTTSQNKVGYIGLILLEILNAYYDTSWLDATIIIL